MKIWEAAAGVLSAAQAPMTCAEITSEILRRKLYEFHTQDPVSMVMVAIDCRCEGPGMAVPAEKKPFVRMEQKGGAALYALRGRDEKILREESPQVQAEETKEPDDAPLTIGAPWGLVDGIMLVEAYYESKRGERESVVLKKLSWDLRGIAEANGAAFDRKYRSLEDLTVPFEAVKYLDTGGKRGSGQANEAVRAAFELRATNPRTFYERLMRAKIMIRNSEAFRQKVRPER